MKRRTLMALILLVLSCVLLAAVAVMFRPPRAGEYRASVIELGLGFVAKEFCSCLFVSERSEELCREYAAIEQVNPKISINREAGRVESRLLWWRREAQYHGAERGCVLQ